MKTKVELSRTAIVGRALDIADAEGIAAITVRRLATEFDVTPMALYWHVKNKDELLEAMGDALFADIDSEVDPSQPWIEQLRTLVDRLVTALRAHPAAVQLAFPRILMTEPGQRLSERVFELLRTAGFSIRETASIGTHALRTAVMLVADEPGQSFGLTEGEREAMLAHKKAELTALPIGRYPRLHEMVDAMLGCEDEDDYYRFGVDLFVSGVARLQAQMPVSS